VNEINAEFGLAGYYTIEVKRPDGSVRERLEFKNLILNAGLDRWGSGGLVTYCQVGTGNTTPTNTDTALVAKTAHQNYTYISGGNSGNDYGYAIWKASFAVGAATGTLAEVGTGWGTTGSLFSRALFMSGGSPTTITVLSDESLDVTYELRMYVPQTDVTGNIVLHDTTSYAYTLRASSGWSTYSAQGLAVSLLANSSYAYDGAIGALGANPSGATSMASSVSDATYSAGSYQRDGTLTWNTSAGNLSGGIDAIKYSVAYLNFQIGFTPAIPKDNTKSLSLTVRTTWGRH